MFSFFDLQHIRAKKSIKNVVSVFYKVLFYG